MLSKARFQFILPKIPPRVKKAFQRFFVQAPVGFAAARQHRGLLFFCPAWENAFVADAKRMMTGGVPMDTKQML